MRLKCALNPKGLQLESRTGVYVVRIEKGNIIIPKIFIYGAYYYVWYVILGSVIIIKAKYLKVTFSYFNF